MAGNKSNNTSERNAAGNPGSRNTVIDLLRIVFTVLTVLQHSTVMGNFGENITWVNSGNFAVEFFFMVSGYLMIASFQKVKDEDRSIPDKTTAFMKHKISALALPYIVSTVAALIIVPIPKIIADEIGYAGLFTNLIKHIPELFGIYGAGYAIYDITGNSASWYISCMLIGMLIVYPLLCKYKETFVKIWCPVIGILLMGYRISHLKDYGAWNVFTDIPVSTGVLRSINGLCFGGVVYTLSQKIRVLKFTKLGKVMLRTVEMGGWIMIVLGIVLSKALNIHYGLEIMMIPLLAVTFSRNSSAAVPFISGAISTLGKNMIYLYLAHWPIILFMRQQYHTDNYWKNTLILYCAATVAAFIYWVICRMIRKIIPAVRKKIIVSE